MTRLVDLDDLAGLERAWAELERVRTVRVADPELREAIERRLESLSSEEAAPVLAALDELHPEVVLESFFDVLAGELLHKPTIGALRRSARGLAVAGRESPAAPSPRPAPPEVAA